MWPFKPRPHGRTVYRLRTGEVILADAGTTARAAAWVAEHNKQHPNDPWRTR